MTCVRPVRRLQRHGKRCKVLSELPVRKLSYQGRPARTRRTVLRHARANGALLAVAHLNQPFVSP